MASRNIPVEDRLEIQALVAQYAFLSDTAKYTDVADLFTEDGVFDESILGAPPVQGREPMRKMLGQMGSVAIYVIHLNSSHRIAEYSGDSAKGTVHLHCESVLFKDHKCRILGYYDDEYQKTAKGWLIKKRKLVAIAPLEGFPIDWKASR